MQYVVKKFNREDLIDLLDGVDDTLVIIEDDIIDNSRWSIIHSLVFFEKSTGEYYSVTYSHGATECQDEGPFEYDPDEIECCQVEPVEVTVIQYHNVKID